MPCSRTALANDQRIEEMVVTASRTEKPLSSIPNTITLIDEVELARQISVSSDLSTVLGNLIPSFSPARQKMTNAGESLRGRKPLYMIDGVPQSNPLRDGSRNGHTIDPLMLERVEVIHGANAIHGMGRTAAWTVIWTDAISPPAAANLSWVRTWTDNLSTRLQANLLLDSDFENSTGETVAEFDGYTTIAASANLTNEDYFTYYSQTAGNDERNFKGLGRSVNLSYSRLF